MGAKHTAGQWRIDPDHRECMDWNNHIVSVLNPNRCICFMAHDGTPENEVGEANARLIAAAPDLLEAAENAIEALIGCCIPAGGVDDRETIIDTRAMLRAAIAK